VKKAVRIKDNMPVAVKTVKKTGPGENLTHNEVRAMRLVSHPSILKLVDVWEDDVTCYIVSEYASGGELLTEVLASGFYSEEVAADILRQLTGAVMHLHEHSVVHRDVKLDNILLAAPGSAKIKLSDMGLCGIVRDDAGQELALFGRSGTLNYMAPEVVRRDPAGYGPECDWWSVGVCLYILLVGHFPFYGSPAEIEASIAEGRFNFDGADPDLSEDAKDLVSKLLVVDREQRFTGRDILHHRWLLGGARKDSMSLKTLDSLRSFMAKKKLRRGVNAIRAGIRMRNMFSSMNSSLERLGTEDSPERRGSITNSLQDEIAYCKRELEQLREELDLTQTDLEKERSKNAKLGKAVKRLLASQEGHKIELLALLG
jgi:calcium/calmodulin-dependent protein kinase I